jgi:hypothetical protein
MQLLRKYSAKLQALAFIRVYRTNDRAASSKPSIGFWMPSATDLELAHRVLDTIESHGQVKQRDAYALRLSARPGSRTRRLEDLARDIIAASRPVLRQHHLG